MIMKSKTINETSNEAHKNIRNFLFLVKKVKKFYGNSLKELLC